MKLSVNCYGNSTKANSQPHPAHWHKLHLQQLGPTLHIQIPALETGSDHHDQRHGGGEPGGLITLTTCHRSWGNLTQT